MASLLNKRNTTNGNVWKSLKKTNTYKKEQQEYFQSQINKTRNFFKDKQTQLSWQTVNEVNRRKGNRYQPKR